MIVNGYVVGNELCIPDNRCILFGNELYIPDNRCILSVL